MSPTEEIRNEERRERLVAVCLVVLPMLATAAPAAAYLLPDTGLVTCFDPATGAEIACAGTGQDGQYSRNPLSSTDNGDGTVTDDNTGLMWQQQSDGETYNLYEAQGKYHQTLNPSTLDVCGALDLGGGSREAPPRKAQGGADPAPGGK